MRLRIPSWSDWIVTLFLHSLTVIPHGTLFFCMYTAVEADDGVKIINSSKDVVVGGVRLMVFFILSLYLSNCVVDVEAEIGRAHV